MSLGPAPTRTLFLPGAQLQSARIRGLGGLLRLGGRKIGEGIEGLGRKIKGIFSSLRPRPES